MRSIYAQQDSTNQVLKVQPDASYYHFLKEIPLDEPSALADLSIGIFLNRFEFMSPLSAAYQDQKTCRTMKLSRLCPATKDAATSTEIL